MHLAKTAYLMKMPLEYGCEKSAHEKVAEIRP
jgi:hypothetical protein